MQQHVVSDDDGPDLEFEGENLVDEHHHDIGFIKVFRTRAGEYVLTQSHSLRPGVRITKRTLVVSSAEEIGDLLGFTQGAKAVKKKLGPSVRRRI